jgi:hypothetical protein
MTTALLTGLGLATAAGLNAYIPLFVVGLAAQLEWLTLPAPYDALGEWPVLVLVGVLLTVELFSDKIPLIDSVGDVIGTVVRPAAGALLFAGSLGVVDAPEWLGLALGLVTAGGVHTAKAAFRPAANAATGGVAAPVVSTVEDGISFGTTLIALLVPVLVIVVLAALVIGAWRWGRRARTRSRPSAPPPLQ